MQLNRAQSIIVLMAFLTLPAQPGAWAKPDSHKDAASAGHHAPSSAHVSPPANVAAAAKTALRPPGAAVGAPASNTAPSDPKTLPDYGGRDTAGGPSFEGAAGVDAPNPAAQAWRAFEALVIVLALVFGGLSLLKRLGIVGAGGVMAFGGSGVRAMARRIIAPSSPAPIAGGVIRMLGAQPLPGNPGACVHLLTIDGRTFLLGATSQSVTLLGEWESGDAEDDGDVTPEAFSDYLVRQGAAAPTPLEQDIVERRVSESNVRLRDLLSRVRSEQVEAHAEKIEV